MHQDQSRLRTAVTLTASAAAILLAGSPPAAAHGTERGLVLLLPTGYYIAGGGAAVAASFLLISLVPPRTLSVLAAARIPLATIPAVSPVPTSLGSFLLLAFLLAAGISGSRDPLANPLPLAIWTVWWVGVTLLHALAGNLWAYINPWTGPRWLMARLTRGRVGGNVLFAYPPWFGYVPAILFFSGFAWLELVYPAPEDPDRLAAAVGAYWLAAFAGILLFGERDWLARAEPFSIFLRLVAGLSPFVLSRTPGQRRTVSLALPGAALVERDPLPLSGVLFILLTLSSVSFDGLSRTFFWLAQGDINPLEFPGRSALVERNSVGLLAAFAALVLVYGLAVLAGRAMAGATTSLAPVRGSLIYSIVPISIGFHFSHYLTALLVDGQYAIMAASDPFATGLDLLGVGHKHVTTSFLSTYEGVRAIWNIQTAGIVAGHVVAVLLAHAVAVRQLGDGRVATISHLPLAALMIAYTCFGLWLLATPSLG